MFYRTEARRISLGRHCRYRNFLDLTGSLVPEDDILVEKGVFIEPVVFIEPYIDIIILSIELVYPGFLPKEGTAQLLSHGTNGNAQFPCLFTIDNYLHGGFALIDIYFQFFDARDVFGIDKVPDVFGSVDQFIIVFPFQFNIDGVACRGAIGFFSTEMATPG